jgi:hypothetical protein
MDSFSAPTFTVKKAKGKQAIIESSILLTEGVTYTLSANAEPKSQANSFSLGIDSSFFKSTQLQEHNVTIESRYGFNNEDYMFGPLLRIYAYDEGAGFNTDVNIGGYFDYNLVPNSGREGFIYGITGQAYAGNREFTNGASANIFAFGAGGFVAWFLSSTTALRTEGVVLQKRISTAQASANATGFAGKMFLEFYF